MLPVHKALLFARSDVVELFLSVENSIAQIPYRDIPITHLALSLAGFESFQDQCASCLMTLLNNGANVNATDRLGRTVLHWAAFYSMPVLAEQLLARGLDILKEDYEQMTALDICFESDHVETLELFVRFSALHLFN